MKGMDGRKNRKNNFAIPYLLNRYITLKLRKENKYIGRLLRNYLKQSLFADKINRKKIATQFLTALCSVRNRLAADFFEFAARKKS